MISTVDPEPPLRHLRPFAVAALFFMEIERVVYQALT